MLWWTDSSSCFLEVHAHLLIFSSDYISRSVVRRPVDNINASNILYHVILNLNTYSTFYHITTIYDVICARTSSLYLELHHCTIRIHYAVERVHHKLCVQVGIHVHICPENCFPNLMLANNALQWTFLL